MSLIQPCPRNRRAGLLHALVAFRRSAFLQSEPFVHEALEAFGVDGRMGLAAQPTRAECRQIESLASFFRSAKARLVTMRSWLR